MLIVRNGGIKTAWYIAGILSFFGYLSETATAESVGVPDTIAVCFGKDECGSCLTMRTVVPDNTSHLTILPSAVACRENLGTTAGFQPKLDYQTFAYDRHDRLTDTSSVLGSLTYTNSTPFSSGGSVGAAAAVLSSQMRQDLEAQQSSDVSIRLNNIRSAINTASEKLNVSYQQTVAGLSKFDSEANARLDAHSDSLANSIADSAPQLIALQSTTIPDLPKRSGDAPPFGASALGDAAIKEEIARSIPVENLRPYGNDLGGVLGRSQNTSDGKADVDAVISAEKSKLDAALSAKRISPALHARLRQQLTSAENLSKNGDKAALIIANRIYEDTQSERYAAEGKSSVREQTIVEEDGSLSKEIVPAETPVSPDAVGNVVVRLSMKIELASQLSSNAATAAAEYQGPNKEVRNDVANLAVKFAKGAQEAFFKGQLVDTQTLVEASAMLADLATNWVPALSVSRSLYELITGRDLITSEQLTDLELAGRVLDLATIGIGGKLIKGFETVRRISQPIINSARYKGIISASERFAQKAVAKGIAPKIEFSRLKHIVERHVAGGSEVGRHKLDAVFKNPDEILDLAIDAVKHPDAIVIPDKRGFGILYIWKRGENASVIGYGTNPPFTEARDIAVFVTIENPQIWTIFPYLPRPPHLR